MVNCDLKGNYLLFTLTLLQIYTQFALTLLQDDCIFTLTLLQRYWKFGLTLCDVGEYQDPLTTK